MDDILNVGSVERLHNKTALCSTQRGFKKCSGMVCQHLGGSFKE